MAGCRLDPEIFNIDKLVYTERELLEKMQTLDFSLKVKERATNLVRRAFRLYRGITIADLLVQRRKTRKQEREDMKKVMESVHQEATQ